MASYLSFQQQVIFTWAGTVWGFAVVSSSFIPAEANRLFTESPVVGLCLVVWLQHSQNISVSLGKRERIEKVTGTHADARGLASFTHLICVFHPFKFARIRRIGLHNRKGHCRSPEGFSLTISGVILVLQKVNVVQRPYLGSSRRSTSQLHSAS